MDDSTKKQLALLAVALAFNDQLDTRLVALLALLNFYGNDKKDDKTIRASIQKIIGASSADPEELAGAIIEWVVPKNKWYPYETRERFEFQLKRALFSGLFKNDTSEAYKVAKRFSSSVKLLHRMKVFAEANYNVLDAATAGEYGESERGGLVIWRARSQADGPCQEYNRRIMTVEEFKARYPVHYNCMCTAELIPPTMSDKRIKNFLLKKQREATT
ncbi:hypothetical protein [Enterococcus termitis]|uniref:Uncharacterized protein n=1 Tax=Enterococcus termitis TaxID=332950 RepID=A0A1E5H004_9ENTE|nr:hypothetical protein [Enterococcus termitis]OEG18155.1 hypothetical protein BCR25_16815 [Enterococcus termitis]OJG97185.1 hypothetical protein RV18_GL001050 [Enterococcus termitis]